MSKPLQHSPWYRRPAYFLLLPVFFVLHGFQENKGFVPAADALLLCGMYLLAALVLYGICLLLFRNHYKAALGSFLLMGLHFFFGGMHDLLKSATGDGFIGKYSVLLPLLLVVFIIIFRWIKRSGHTFHRTAAYLNILLAVLIAWDVILLARSEQPPASTASTLACDTCRKPDIYLVIMDEYAGKESLKDLFGFDNAAFEQQLAARGFHVVQNSRSNYNYTPFSVASTLNMKYLELENTNRLKPDLAQAFSLINTNEVTRLLQGSGYTFSNHSVFNLPGRPAPIEETFIPAKTRLITAQTLLSRLDRDLGYHLVTTFKIKPVVHHQAYRELRNNTRLYDLTWKLAANPVAQPQFVYTHLMMPHYPYYFDRNGKPMDPGRVLPEANNINRKDYVEYLQYANRKMLELADHLLSVSKEKPVIILMSDHGFRHFRQPVEKKYHFMNLNAVYLPGGNYSGFYDSLSNVNQFRVIFNELFKSGYPMLNDSSVYLKD